MSNPQPFFRPDLLCAEQVAKMLSVSVRTVWRMLNRGQLPEPIRLNRKLVRWRTTDILAYLQQMLPAAVS